MIGIIGCGNMAQAIVKGFHTKDSSQKFMTYTPTRVRAEALAQEVGGVTATQLADLQEAATLVIACKPQQFADLAAELKKSSVDLTNKHVLSIMAAVPLKSIQTSLNVKKVSRVMPNTPCLLGQGMSLILHSEEVTDSEKKLVETFFKSCGETVNLDSERVFDQVTTVSGSGPAYVFLFAETMVNKLSTWGVEPHEARQIVVQLFKGSSALMDEKRDISLEELLAQVTSKGGVTIEAVNTYREKNLEQISSQALDKAFARSKELQKLFK